jgi:predicted nucleic acid-binding protein
MRDYILDIDHIVGLIGGNEDLLSRLRDLKKTDARFGITNTILADLYFLVRSSAQMTANTASLTELMGDLYVWDMDRGAAEITGEILTQSRSLGRPISVPEAQIAAVARQRQAVLLSSQPSYANVRDIDLQNWLEPASRRH